MIRVKALEDCWSQGSRRMKGAEFLVPEEFRIPPHMVVMSRGEAAPEPSLLRPDPAGELAALKKRARDLSVKFGNQIGLETLRERVEKAELQLLAG